MPARAETFVCEVELRTTPHDRRVLRARLEAARQLYNAVLGELLGRLRAARRDPAWAAARALPTAKARGAAFAGLRTRYGLSEYDAHKHPSLRRDCWIRGHLDANTAQKAATAAWRAVQAEMFAHKGHPRFRCRGQLRSVEGKKANVGIRLLGWHEGDSTLAWDGAHARLRMALLLDREDGLHAHARGRRVKYVRLVRREIRGRERYFAQLIVEGQPPAKPVRENGRFGIDVGPSRVAVCDERGNAERHRLADGVIEPARKKRRYQRRIDRQRRAGNPDCYDDRGRPIRGRRPTRRSHRQRRAEHRLREAARKLAARRRNEHGRLANRLLAVFGPCVHAEQISYRAFQRRFGRSARDRAPGGFMTALARKVVQHGHGLVEIPTATTFLSQRCLCGARRRKQLSERQHRCGCRHVPDGAWADRDELAAFLAIFCDENGSFDQVAAVAAWEGGANDRLLRADRARESAAKPRAPVSRRAAHNGQSGSAGKRQRTPVRPPRKSVGGQPRGQGRSTRLAAGPSPPTPVVGIIRRPPCARLPAAPAAGRS